MNKIFIVEIAFFISLFVIVFSLIYYVLDKKANKDMYIESEDIYIKKNSIIDKIKTYVGIKGGDEKENLNWYFRIEKHLKATGTPYDLNAKGYLLLKLIMAIAGFFIAKLFVDYLVVTIVLPVLGFFFLDIMIYSKNKKEIKIINYQMKELYDSLKLQTISGTYIITALSDCYLVVSNKRLKKSLAVLSAKIYSKNNINEALEDFREKFISDEIDNLVLTIQQSLKTGKIQEQLDKQVEDLNDIQQVAAKESTAKIKNKTDLIELLAFLGIFLTTLYYCSMLLSQSTTNAYF